MKKLVSIITAFALWLSVLPVAPFATIPVVMVVAGCNGPSNAQIAADGAAVSTALKGIASVYAATNPQAAAELDTAASSILTITANWNGDSSLALFNSAANAAETILADIPQTAQYAVLVPIAVAAIDVLIANLPASSTAKAQLVAPSKKPVYSVGVIKHQWGRSIEGDFKAAWNSTIEKNHIEGVGKL